MWKYDVPSSVSQSELLILEDIIHHGPLRFGNFCFPSSGRDHCDTATKRASAVKTFRAVSRISFRAFFEQSPCPGIVMCLPGPVAQGLEIVVVQLDVE